MDLHSFKRTSRSRRVKRALAAFAALGVVGVAASFAVAGWIDSEGQLDGMRARGSELLSAVTGTLTGAPRLVAYDPFPPEDGEHCDYPLVPAAYSGELPLRTALMQARVAAGATSAENLFETQDASQRKPLRMIRDPYAAYSAVAVDPANNEVVLTDENLFNIWVYDRSAKTSPNASTEPKRLIGGLNTKIEFQCGLYIDPSNGDIYAVNNDTIDTLVVFSRQAIVSLFTA